MKKALLYTFFLFILSNNSTINAVRPESRITGTFENWNTVITKGVSTSVVSFPVKTSNITKIFKRYDPYVTLIKYGKYLEFSLSTGFKARSNQKILIEFYKKKEKKPSSSYKLYTLDIYAYPYNKDNEKIINDLKNYDHLIVYCESPDDMYVVDQYNLSGFLQSLNRLLNGRI